MNVLVIDDSAVMRLVTTEVLSREPGVTVTSAADPIVARDKMARSRPDVILLDLEMPRMDGLTFLRKLMRDDPLPVVICSAFAERGSHQALQALDAGALDVVAKPQAGVREFLEESAVMLIDALRAAAEAGARRRAPRPRATLLPLPAAAGPRPRLVAVGSSTGGPEALCVLLRSWPGDAPPMVIAQHMPALFTGQFARRLDSLCACAVSEARDGDELVAGRVLVAPGGRHLLVRRAGTRLFAQVADGPLVSRHRPSVDVLFESVAAAAGSGAVGALLTGMGDDGARGMRGLRSAGALTIAEDESTCVVYGMPRAAVELGAAELVLPLPAIAELLRQKASPQLPRREC